MNLVLEKTFSDTLVAWQTKHGRHDLPWQKNRTAYRVWLSEIMLQQTQVATVLERYVTFLEKFPTVEDLAAAHLDEVLAQWSGLGYYSRARNLHACAQAVITKFDGRFPESVDQLVMLPGIGKSTAAAIAVFAYGRRAAILDGNVKRVLTRIFGYDGDLTKAANLKVFWDFAQTLLPHQSRKLVPYTQGLMDFGATACKPSQPICQKHESEFLCPFQQHCVAYQQNRIADFPIKRKAVRVRDQEMFWLIARRKNQIYLEQRGPGIWRGLWCFPEGPSPVSHDGQFPHIDHVLTHRRLRIQPVAVQPAMVAERLGKWWTVDEAMQLGIPKPVRDFLLSLDQAHDAF